VKAWKGALAGSIATAVIALIVVAPMAQSSKSSKGLKIVTEVSSGSTDATAKCPRGYVVIGGGFNSQETGGVARSEKVDQRRWAVRGAVLPKRGQLVEAQAICAKGTGGFRVSDAG
jgi:hypothetical protein